MQTEPAPAAARPIFRDQPLSGWREWEIVSRCRSDTCRPNRAIPVRDVLAIKGEAMPLARLVGYLRCSTCGERPHDVGLRKRSGGGEIWQLVQGGPFW